MQSCLKLLVAAVIVVLVASPALAIVGPTSTLYIMNYGEFGSNTGLDLVQGVTATSYNTGLPVDIDIAVYGDVRTMGYGNTDQGARFDTAGNPLPGGPYTNNIADSQLHDGTSDGDYNYSVNYSTSEVLQFDRNWGSPLALFNVFSNTGVQQAGYITMNVADGSFWVSQWGGPDVVMHFTHGGSLLSTFNSGITGGVASAGLALDPVDGTLWMGDTNYKLHQFDQAGNLLQTVAYPSLAAGGWYGMEFNTVPEPSAITLLTIGAVSVALTVRRRLENSN